MMAQPPAPPLDPTPIRRQQRLAVNVPTDLLRTFVAIADAGSMALAKESVFLTQSALSLQMKRLEDLLQQRLFHRHGRSLMLTAAGEELLSLARQLLGLNDRIVSSLGSGFDEEPVQLGLVQDFADTVLPQVLSDFAHRHPRMRIQLRVAGSAELLDLFERAKLDLLVGLGRHGELRRGTSRTIREVSMAWIGGPHLAERPELPLVLLEQPCAFRTALLEALERHERRYRIVLETPSLPGLRAALQAGIGLSCRTASYAETATVPIIADGVLPPLPRIDYVLLRRDPAPATIRDLDTALERALAMGITAEQPG